ncbi:MAG TPA: glycoside hydrolase family 30 beta sandwich domain-containing protein [Candidatus Acidoferrum sp.]
MMLQNRKALLSAAVFFCFFAIPDVILAQTVKLHVSSKAGDRLTAKPDLQFSDSKLSSGANFKINGDVKLQKIDGFGASIMEAGIMTLNTLPADKQEEVLRALFDPQAGAGFTAMKTPVAGTDFQSAGPWYTYDDTPGDVELKNFSVERDFGPNGVGTYILRARKYGNFVLQAPIDYPPDWMLFDVKKHQDIQPKYYAVLAKYFIRYLEEYKKRGIVVDYLSLFNEPEEVYTKIKYPEITILLRDFVGPALQQSGLATKLMMSEAPERKVAYKRYPVVLDDPAARKFVSVVAYHGYDFKNFDKIAELEKKYPDLPFWMDELCYAYEAGYPKNKKLPIYDFDDGDVWGNIIFNDLEAGTSAWLYWNAILDETGGPWAVSPVHGNPDPNIQHPVVILNKTTHEITYTGTYYYLAHFSKFVRPGAVRIQTSGNTKGVRTMGFQTPEGGFVVQLLNSLDRESAVNIESKGRTLHVELPATSISTVTW